jgi:hypothetical protein
VVGGDVLRGIEAGEVAAVGIGRAREGGRDVVLQVVPVELGGAAGQALPHAPAHVVPVLLDGDGAAVAVLADALLQGLVGDFSVGVVDGALHGVGERVAALALGERGGLDLLADRVVLEEADRMAPAFAVLVGLPLLGDVAGGVVAHIAVGLGLVAVDGVAHLDGAAEGVVAGGGDLVVAVGGRGVEQLVLAVALAGGRGEHARGGAVGVAGALHGVA